MQNAKAKRLTACIMSILIPVFVLVSAFFIAAETDHDCCGDDCPICACIHLCENTLEQIGSGVATQAAVIIPAILFCISILLYVCVCRQDTPVSRKVRQNN